MNEQLPLDSLLNELQNCRRNDTIIVIQKILADWLRSNRFVGQNTVMQPVSRLATQLNVARQTIQKVYLQLEAEQLIFRREHESIWRIRSSRNSNLLNIALILPAMFSDYYLPSAEYGQRHFGVYSGMTDRAMELGYALVPRQLPPPDAPKEDIFEAIEEFKSHYIGVVHVGERGFANDLPLLELLTQQDIPQIAIDCEFDYPWIGSVTFDPEYVARIVGNCLREYGHRNIGLVYPRIHAPERIPNCTYLMITQKAILDAFHRIPIKFNRIFEIVTDHHEFGAKFEKQVLNAVRSPRAPTAFWCRDDISAMELIRFLNSIGYSVPRDFSVIGFDDLPASENFDPPLTTLRNPIYELGYTAISHLDDCIRHGPGSFKRITRLPPILNLRKSVGTIRAPVQNSSRLPVGSETAGKRVNE